MSCGAKLAVGKVSSVSGLKGQDMFFFRTVLQTKRLLLCGKTINISSVLGCRGVHMASRWCK